MTKREQSVQIAAWVEPKLKEALERYTKARKCASVSHALRLILEDVLAEYIKDEYQEETQQIALFDPEASNG